MAKDEFVSLADLGKYDDELVGFNPEADANAQLPPIPGGDYVVRVYFQDDDQNQIWHPDLTKETSIKYLWANVVAEVVENPINPPETVGRKVFHRAMSLVMKNTGTTGIQAIVQGLGKGDMFQNVPRTMGKQAEVLTEALSSKPLAVLNTDWEAVALDPDGNKVLWRIRGMKRFPKDPETPGKYIHIVDHKEHGELRGRNIVVRWSTLASLANKKTAATATGEKVDKPAVAPPASTPAGSTVPAAKPTPAPQPHQHKGPAPVTTAPPK